MNRFAVMLCLLGVLVACGGGGGKTGESIVSQSSLLLTTEHGGDGAAWGLENCNACHKLELLHQHAGNIQGLVRIKGYASCTGCHGGNGTVLKRQCLICHNPVDLPAAPRQVGSHRHGFAASASSGTSNKASDEDCLVCHEAADMDGVFEVERDLSRLPDDKRFYSAYASISDFCLRCHNRDHQQAAFPITGRSDNDPLVAIEDAYLYIDKHGEADGLGNRVYTGLRPGYVYASRVACTDCHSMHGTNNLNLIIDRSDSGVSRLDAELREQPIEVETRNGDYSQLCVLCHQMQTVQEQGNTDTGNGLSGVHEVGGDCLTCHRHGEAVQAGM